MIPTDLALRIASGGFGLLLTKAGYHGIRGEAITFFGRGIPPTSKTFQGRGARVLGVACFVFAGLLFLIAWQGATTR